jgi:hypothetical protein
MLAHMRTSIDISDALLTQARAVMRKRGVTLRHLVEEGLRAAIAAPPDPPFVLRDASFQGELGFAPGSGPGDIPQVLAEWNEGRPIP